MILYVAIVSVCFDRGFQPKYNRGLSFPTRHRIHQHLYFCNLYRHTNGLLFFHCSCLFDHFYFHLLVKRFSFSENARKCNMSLLHKHKYNNDLLIVKILLDGIRLKKSIWFVSHKGSHTKQKAIHYFYKFIQAHLYPVTKHRQTI